MVAGKDEELPSISGRFQFRSQPNLQVSDLLLYSAVASRYFEARGATAFMYPQFETGGWDFDIELIKRCPQYNDERDLDSSATDSYCI